MFYTESEPDLDDAPRRTPRGRRCPECWTYFGHSPGCPEDDTPDREDGEIMAQ